MPEAPPTPAQVVGEVSEEEGKHALPGVLPQVDELVGKQLEALGGAASAGLGGRGPEADVSAERHRRRAAEPGQQRRSPAAVHPRGGEVRAERDLEQPPRRRVEEILSRLDRPAPRGFVSRVSVPFVCPR
jgi:hypothetical protein